MDPRVRARLLAAPLSPLQRLVLLGLAAGLRRAELAAVLYISIKTVDAHIDHASAKLQSNRTIHTFALALLRRDITLAQLGAIVDAPDPGVALRMEAARVRGQRVKPGPKPKQVRSCWGRRALTAAAR